MINISSINKTGKAKLIFIMSATVSLFWCMGQLGNVYQFSFIGAVFEILWFPMLAMLLLLPILSMVFWVKEKFDIRSLYLYSILILVIPVLLLALLQ